MKARKSLGPFMTLVLSLTLPQPGMATHVSQPSLARVTSRLASREYRAVAQAWTVTSDDDDPTLDSVVQ